MTAVERLRGYYFKRGIDMFKISVSVPGLARQMLFECRRKDGASFALFDEANNDPYRTINKTSLENPRLSFIDFTKTTRPSYEEIPKRAVTKFLDSTPMRYISTAWINPCPPDHSSDDTLRTGFIPRSVINTLSCSIGWTFSITVTAVRYNTNSIRVKIRNSDPIPLTVSTRRQMPSNNYMVVIVMPTRAGSPNPHFVLAFELIVHSLYQGCVINVFIFFVWILSFVLFRFLWYYT